MEKFDLSQAVGVCLYMLIEHELGKSTHGSLVGLVRNKSLCILSLFLRKK